MKHASPFGTQESKRKQMTLSSFFSPPLNKSLSQQPSQGGNTVPRTPLVEQNSSQCSSSDVQVPLSRKRPYALDVSAFPDSQGKHAFAQSCR